MSSFRELVDKLYQLNAAQQLTTSSKLNREKHAQQLSTSGELNAEKQAISEPGHAHR
jgi:hypothetical protein